MSQDELAERMGYKSRSTIAKIEKGVNDVVHTNVLKFAKVLNVSVATLTGLNESIEKNPMEMAEKHAEMLKDEDYVEIYQYYKSLNAKKRKIVKDLMRSLADD